MPPRSRGRRRGQVGRPRRSVNSSPSTSNTAHLGNPQQSQQDHPESSRSPFVSTTTDSELSADSVSDVQSTSSASDQEGEGNLSDDSDDQDAEGDEDSDEEDTHLTTDHHEPTHVTPRSKQPPQRPASAPRSQSHLGPPAAFAPPFYNRPPTPLPPSPSLTSLLRPPFSSSRSSRPTTPESSDAEMTTGGTPTPASTAAAVAQSARAARTVPRASPKVPTYEYYGFVVYLLSSAAFAIYLLWSYLPSPFLHQLGIYYYPYRWWSLAVPAWLVAVVVYIYVALAAWNTGYLTLPMNSLECLVDEKGRVAVVGGKRLGIGDAKKGQSKSGEGVVPGLEAPTLVVDDRSEYGQAEKVPSVQGWRTLWNEGTDAVMDIPVGGVCEVLYGSERDE